MQQTGTYVVFLDKGVVGVYLIDALLTESNVEYLQASDIHLILREQEREFRQLKSQGKIGSNNISADIIGVILSHKPRRYVDADHLSR